jgi:hypothetical protein
MIDKACQKLEVLSIPLTSQYVQRLGNLAWHMEGDVAGALIEGVKRGGIPWELHAGSLFRIRL